MMNRHKESVAYPHFLYQSPGFLKSVENLCLQVSSYAGDGQDDGGLLCLKRRGSACGTPSLVLCLCCVLCLCILPCFTCLLGDCHLDGFHLDDFHLGDCHLDRSAGDAPAVLSRMPCTALL